MKKLLTGIRFEVNNEIYQADVEVEFVIDNQFGADIDGNRGIRKVLIDDIDVLNVQDLDGRDVLYNQDTMFDILYDAVNELKETLLEK